MNFETIRLEREDGIGILTFNRPEVMNAHNYQMRLEEQAATLEAQNDPEVRVLIVTGAGRAFHAGDDAKERFSGGVDKLKADRWAAVVGKLGKDAWVGQPNPRYYYDFPKPTIAAVNGAAVGAGFSIALSCDIRLASDAARFGYLYTRRGITGGSQGLIKLLHVVGASRAMEIMLTGEMIGAADAERMGLVSRVVPQGELLEEARILARRLMKGAPLAQRAIKATMYKALYDPAGIEDFSLRYDEALGESEDHREGFAAFNEKREPVWKGK
jgi:enoyl-CoA hydratase/carnithine racemase